MSFVTDFWSGTDGEWADPSDSPIVSVVDDIASDFIGENWPAVDFSSTSDSSDTSE